MQVHHFISFRSILSEKLTAIVLSFPIVISASVDSILLSASANGELYCNGFTALQWFDGPNANAVQVFLLYSYYFTILLYYTILYYTTILFYTIFFRIAVLMKYWKILFDWILNWMVMISGLESMRFSNLAQFQDRYSYQIEKGLLI